MRRSQERSMWLAMPATASARFGSEAKKRPMSLAIFTRLSALLRISAARSGAGGLGRARFAQELALPLVELAVTALPFGRLIDAYRLYRGDLVFRAVGRPVRIVRGDDVGARIGEMERRVDDPGQHARRDACPQHRLARPALYTDPVVLPDAALLGVVRVDLDAILVVPQVVGRAARLRADVVLRENAPGGQDQRVAGVDLLVGRHIFGDQETALATHERVHVHDRRALRMLVIAGPLDAAEAVELLVAHAMEGRREARDLVHDLRGMSIVHRVPERVGEQLCALPVRIAPLRMHDAADARDAPLGVDEYAVLLQERRARQEHVRKL